MSKIVIGKIFGIGMGRTGCSSLREALQELGYIVLQVNKTPLIPELIEIIKEYDGALDSPIAYQYKELDKLFPNSKFILTTRTLESWLKSIEYFLTITGVLPRPAKNQIVMKSLWGDVKFNKETFTNGWKKHHKEVKEYFKYRELLVMNLPKGDGWKKLCYFLGKEIPNKPFPHEYSTESIKKSLRK